MNKTKKTEGTNKNNKQSEIIKIINLETKATTATTRVRTLAELKADVDSKLEKELLIAASQYEAIRRAELGLSGQLS